MAKYVTVHLAPFADVWQVGAVNGLPWITIEYLSDVAAAAEMPIQMEMDGLLGEVVATECSDLVTNLQRL